MYNPILKDAMKYYKKTEGKIKIMCEIWEEIKNDGIQEGIKKGQLETNTNAIKNIMETLNYCIVDAMVLLKIPEDEYDKYKELVLK